MTPIVKPFRHVLMFSYRGRDWKAIFFGHNDPAILRRYVPHADVTGHLDTSIDDFAISWSVARGPADKATLAVLTKAAEYLNSWRWPRKLDLREDRHYLSVNLTGETQ